MLTLAIAGAGSDDPNVQIICQTRRGLCCCPGLPARYLQQTAGDGPCAKLTFVKMQRLTTGPVTIARRQPAGTAAAAQRVGVVQHSMPSHGGRQLSDAAPRCEVASGRHSSEQVPCSPPSQRGSQRSPPTPAPAEGQASPESMSQCRLFVRLHPQHDQAGHSSSVNHRARGWRLAGMPSSLGGLVP